MNTMRLCLALALLARFCGAWLVPRMGMPLPNQRFHVAPMQAYTNRHLRTLCRLLSKEAVLWTEMEKVCDLLASTSAADRRLQHDDRAVLQLGGSDIPSLQQVSLSHSNLRARDREI